MIKKIFCFSAILFFSANTSYAVKLLIPVEKNIEEIEKNLVKKINANVNVKTTQPVKEEVKKEAKEINNKENDIKSIQIKPVKSEVKTEVKEEKKEEVKKEIKKVENKIAEVKKENNIQPKQIVKEEVKKEIKEINNKENDIKSIQIKPVKSEIKTEVKEEKKEEVKKEIKKVENKIVEVKKENNAQPKQIVKEEVKKEAKEINNKKNDIKSIQMKPVKSEVKTEVKEEKKEEVKKEEKEDIIIKQVQPTKEEVKKEDNKIVEEKEEILIIEPVKENKDIEKKDNIRELIITESGIVENKYKNDLNTESITSVDIINEIEKNIISKEKNTNISNEKVEIKKGEWNTKDIIEVKDTKDTEIKKTGTKFKITTKENNNSKNIEQLRQVAYKATKNHEYEIAIKYYKEILKIDPKDNLSKLSLATSYHALKQYAQAKPIYIELMSIFPENQNIVSNLISVIINDSPYEAVYLIPSIAEKYEKSAPIQAQTAVAFAKVKNYNEAINYMQKALLLDRNNLEYLYNLAVMYDMNKDYNKALNLYRKIVNRINNNIVKKNKILQRIQILSKETK